MNVRVKALNMKLVTISVGLPRQVPWKGRTVTTGIYKSPVSGRVHLGKLNLDGDRQADLSLHGGTDKAVYVYPAEHYEFWREKGAADELPHGSFGENFTTTGLLEDSVHIGDQFRIGSAEVVVTQPRLPCYKLGVRFGQAEMVKRFLESRRTGFYLAVLREGEAGAGDEIALLNQDENRVTVSTITRVYLDGDDDPQTLERVLRVTALPLGWRDYFLGWINQGQRQER
jgi:MOSC domain-containing protein YiiM